MSCRTSYCKKCSLTIALLAVAILATTASAQTCLQNEYNLVQKQKLNCTANDTISGQGIVASTHCLIKNCVANSNNGTGISAEVGSVIEDCVASSSTLGDGINAGNSCNIIHCTARANKANGITASSNCRISGCMAADGNSEGIHVNVQCLVEDNFCSANSPPIGVAL